MKYKDATEQKMIAMFAYDSICSMSTILDGGLDFLKKIFLSSLLTPSDVLAQAHRVHMRRGLAQKAIYEDMQYALYFELVNNKDSRVIDAVYECIMEVLSQYGSYRLKNYKKAVKYIRDGIDVEISVDKDGFFPMYYFCFWYENLPISEHLRKNMIRCYEELNDRYHMEDAATKVDILMCCQCDGVSVRELKVYKEGKQTVIQALADYLKQRYSEEVSIEDMPEFIARTIHYGYHGWFDSDGTECYSIDAPDLWDASFFSCLSWLGVQDSNLNMNTLHGVMSDGILSETCGYMDYSPDVDKLINLAFDSCFEPYNADITRPITRAIIRKEVVPRILSNIEAFYERIIMMYYADCIYKIVERYRDEYYYTFPWFYDIEKQDTMVGTSPETEQSKAPTQEDDRYAELNVLYERERKRVNSVSKKHAHELAEKDRALAEQTDEIEKLQKQLQIQQEFINLANTAEEPDVTESLDISCLYGKRFLFVGKLYESNAKLKQIFPTSTFMETDTANIKSLKVDGVVFLIRNMGHSMYYKVMQNNQFAELPKIYCNSRNINNVFHAMLVGMND